MLKYYAADWLFPVNAAPIKNGVVAVNAEGEIIKLLSLQEADPNELNIERYSGAIVPGFINTHCHLELSHMHNQIPEQTGLVEFVQSVIKSRQADEAQIQSAMAAADQQMFDHGIVAVGDVSNQIISREIKQKSKIYYHTFIEAMGFNPERAEVIMDYALQIKAQFLPLPATIVPHAPYSVSPKLFSLINRAIEKNDFISIHNQETSEENDFFISKQGNFLKLYEFLGLDISFFQPTGKTSLQSWLPAIHHSKVLLVHNTQTSQEDILFAKQNKLELYWCLCPQANLYIENMLPDVDLFIKEDVKITLGTDSLASNHQLNILSEMKTLQEKKFISFENLLRWATLNGAAFLNLDDQLGSIEVGKKPGLNLIQLSADFKIKSDVVVKLI